MSYASTLTLAEAIGCDYLNAIQICPLFSWHLLSRGEFPCFDELAAEFNTQWVVHVEHVDCDAANGRATHNIGTI